ncbi:uncharacterized protein LOC131001905 [Salvia miltiorrhiza]|uniref:uncharacterized protein LOC131001905 n=1 Tax=Salvia miltiorrhiza TaxID=226208 RepID=UPI0025ABEDF1|nr:uncharacterized protein LOC131001905 [Salvia miltiorrhiza]
MEDAGMRNHSLFPLETCPHVPDEAFRQFHTIDRELYAALTRPLRRDPAESVQVLAFLMWLEKECADSTLIKRVSSLPPLLINAVADEAAACVRCVESDAFLAGGGVKLLSELLSFPAGVSLRFLHDNRIAVLRGVAKIMNTVCWRAFGDLFHRDVNPDMTVTVPPNFMYNTYVDVPSPPHVAHPHHPPMVAQRQMLSQDLGNLKENKEQEKQVSPDDRTIFLTFSKGYPTSEDEVRDYFTRKFGDFIEDLMMQEVEGDEQPLYAKMVARTPAVIDGIVEGNKAKYSINGKHVWARKYVKKSPQQRSPPTGEASTSASSPAKKA